MVIVSLLKSLGLSLRLMVFAVLAAIEPVVRLVLSLAALAGFACCLIYALSPHAHFPLGLMLFSSTAMAGLLVLYYLLLRALAP